MTVMKHSSAAAWIAGLVTCGIVAAICPFNFPLNLVCHKVGPALAADLSRGEKTFEMTKHKFQALRSFALDRISQAQILNVAAQDRNATELDAHLAGSYGIFSGAAKAWATLKFSPHAARWVADEHWHTQQQGQGRSFPWNQLPFAPPQGPMRCDR